MFDDDLYTRDILRLTTQIRHLGRLQAPDGSAERTSRVCGSRVIVDLNLEDEFITDFAIEISACAIGQASAALLSNQILTASRQEVCIARDELKIMLKGGEPRFPARFAALSALAHVKDHPARHSALLLPFDTTCAAFPLSSKP